MDIANHTVVVTGGASGLGAAVVRRMVKAGSRVAIFDVQKEKGEALAVELGAKGIFCLTDVTNAGSVQNSLARVKENFGNISFLVNAAGTGWVERTVSKTGPHSLETFEQILRLNLIGTFNVASQTAWTMSENHPDEQGERGVIVNVSSTAAFDGQIGQTAYAASKGAVAAMTLPMARDLAGMGIRVVTIAPGIFNTPLLAMLSQEKILALNNSVPFPKRTGDPEEFALLVEQIFQNPYLNGEVIRLDGGLRMAPK
ncbi:MAG TPA: SDR family NAD(P)-dependent oxidoreductase [Smithellaceae bacterium]|jgi:3-hydroxyacyl-CoA dehydrogenase / 3-hydroxy-2-methylbutyryl-CoA dehydrogenase|nr:SDR family NAD(P)-dependent oxidoreductase [Smithellaceae bacterium]HQM45342.1 SDR family NAD(P)-dependent oxidoreductase [Smithellaceae bacterium]